MKRRASTRGESSTAATKKPRSIGSLLLPQNSDEFILPDFRFYYYEYNFIKFHNLFICLGKSKGAHADSQFGEVTIPLSLILHFLGLLFSSLFNY